MIKALLIIIFFSLTLSGCAGVKVTYDDKGRVTKIEQLGGPWPSKGKIGENELDTTFNIFDFNIQGVKA